jgi:hypothetical protein
LEPNKEIKADEDRMPPQQDQALEAEAVPDKVVSPVEMKPVVAVKAAMVATVTLG